MEGRGLALGLDFTHAVYQCRELSAGTARYTTGATLDLIRSNAHKGLAALRAVLSTDEEGEISSGVAQATCLVLQDVERPDFTFPLEPTESGLEALRHLQRAVFGDGAPGATLMRDVHGGTLGQAQAARDLCAATLLDSVCEGNCLSLLSLAESTGSSRLARRCRRVALRGFRRASVEDFAGLVALPKDLLLSLLGDDRLCVPCEADAFRALMAWTEGGAAEVPPGATGPGARGAASGAEPSSRARDLPVNLAACVRLSGMDAEELSYVESHPLVLASRMALAVVAAAFLCRIMGVACTSPFGLKTVDRPRKRREILGPLTSERDLAGRPMAGSLTARPTPRRRVPTAPSGPPADPVSLASLADPDARGLGGPLPGLFGPLAPDSLAHASLADPLSYTYEHPAAEMSMAEAAGALLQDQWSRDSLSSTPSASDAELSPGGARPRPRRSCLEAALTRLARCRVSQGSVGPVDVEAVAAAAVGLDMTLSPADPRVAGRKRALGRRSPLAEGAEPAGDAPASPAAPGSRAGPLEASTPPFPRGERRVRSPVPGAAAARSRRALFGKQGAASSAPAGPPGPTSSSSSASSPSSSTSTASAASPHRRAGSRDWAATSDGGHPHDWASAGSVAAPRDSIGLGSRARSPLDVPSFLPDAADRKSPQPVPGALPSPRLGLATGQLGAEMLLSPTRASVASMVGNYDAPPAGSVAMPSRRRISFD